MDIESRVDKLISYIENTTEIKNKIFLSLGNSNIKATVKLLKPNYLKRNVINEIQKFRKNWKISNLDKVRYCYKK